MTEVAPLRDASTLTDEERHLIASFEPAVAALSALFGPGCEVVLHAFDSLHASVIKDCQRPHHRPPGGERRSPTSRSTSCSAAGSQWSSYFSRTREGSC